LSTYALDIDVNLILLLRIWFSATKDSATADAVRKSGDISEVADWQEGKNSEKISVSREKEPP
jgi:hypothetical protein